MHCLFIAKTAFRKLKPWFILWSFFLLRLLFIYINLPVAISGLVGAYSYLLNVFDKLQKVWYEGITWRYGCQTYLSCFSWTLGSPWKCGLPKSFLRQYFGKCSSELKEMVSLSYSHVKSTPNFNRFFDFSFTICRCYKNVFVNNFFSHTAWL